MATEIQVVNMALALLEEAPITALSDDNKAARLCNLHYAQTRQAELTRHVWAFSVTSAEATGTDLDTGEGTLNWSYPVPTGALRILPLTHDGEPQGIPINWRRQGDVILSDYETPITIRYVEDMTDPADWPPLFVDVVAAALAVKLALPLTHKSGMVEMTRQAYQAALGEARRVNAFEAAGAYYDAGWGSQRGDTRFWRA